MINTNDKPLSRQISAPFWMVWVWLCLVFTPAFAEVGATDGASSVDKGTYTAQTEYMQSAVIRASGAKRQGDTPVLEQPDYPKWLGALRQVSNQKFPVDRTAFVSLPLSRRVAFTTQPRAPPQYL